MQLRTNKRWLNDIYQEYVILACITCAAGAGEKRTTSMWNGGPGFAGYDGTDPIGPMGSQAWNNENRMGEASPPKSYYNIFLARVAPNRDQWRARVDYS